MYRQIRVASKLPPLQIILFRIFPSVQDFEFQTVTFGVNCAPQDVIRTFHQLTEETKSV